MPENDPEPDLEADIRAEGEPGSLVAVVGLTCPDCGRRVEFRARDETPGGHLPCPHCGQRRIKTAGLGLAGTQRWLDDQNRKILSIRQAGEDFNSALQETLRQLRMGSRRR